jgi:hypothetical protein
MTERRHFLIRFRSDSDSDTAIRALRWLLKTALRSFGLRAISIVEETGELGEATDE